MDCLVTKLKGVVSNNSLLKLGEFELGVTNGSKFQTSVLPNTEQFTLTLLDGAKFSDDSTQKTFTYYCDLLTIVGNGKLRVSNKYNIASFKLHDGITGDISVLEYCKPEFFSCRNNPQLVGDVSKLSVKQDSTSIIEIYIDNCQNLSGDITNLLNSINRPNSVVTIHHNGFLIDADRLSNSNIKNFTIYSIPAIGDIENVNLPNVINSLYLSCPGLGGNISNIPYSHMSNASELLIESTSCTGTIEGFADNFKAHKTANSTFRIKCNGIITYQGNPVSRGYWATITFDGAGGYTVSITTPS